MFLPILGLFLSLILTSTSVKGFALPTLSLPWGEWTAEVYENDKNVRRPKSNDGIGDPNFGPSCIQINSTSLKNPPGGSLGDFLGAPPLDQSEDCLFLDIYVPMSAFGKQRAAKLPVVSLLKATNYDTIFVAGNYRLGAFGWLAGNYMQKNGLPNAGLHDQALLLEWVRDFIHLVGGDNTSVSVWGESAGGGSILHHLIRRNEKQLVDPLFQTFLVQSPAFQWSWDNSPNGTLDSVYRNFSQLADCGYDYNIDCLRGKDTGLFPLGPSVDDSWITQIPALSFANDEYWTGIKGALISHVAYEEKRFIPESVKSKATFNDFLNLFLPGNSLAPARQAITKQYNCTLSPWNGNYTACVGTVIRDSTFTCNTRQLFDAYSDRSYMLRFAFPTDATAVHASDLVPTFINNYQEAYNLYYAATNSKFGAELLAVRLTKSTLKPTLQQKFQAYFASFARYGCPNKLLLKTMPTWPVANGTQDDLQKVLQIDGSVLPFKNPFQLVSDTQNTKKSCDFWTNLARSLKSSESLLTKQDPSSWMEL